METAIIVLGYGAAHSRRVHPVQRWRCHIGARTLTATTDGRLIFTGSAARQRSGITEAEAMAAYAIACLGVPPERVTLETNSTDTWENVACAIPIAEACDRIAFASDPLHARRAARYLMQQRPDLDRRLVGALTFEPFEKW